MNLYPRLGRKLSHGQIPLHLMSRTEFDGQCLSNAVPPLTGMARKSIIHRD